MANARQYIEDFVNRYKNDSKFVEKANAAFSAYAQKKTQERQAALQQAQVGIADNAYLKAVQEYMATNKLLRPAFENTLIRGHRNATASEIAPLLSGDAYKWDKSAVDYFTQGGQEKVRQANVAAEDFLKQYIRLGYFDNPQTIQGGYTHLLSDDYIDRMTKEYQEKQAQAEGRRSIQPVLDTVEAASEWLQPGYGKDWDSRYQQAVNTVRPDDDEALERELRVLLDYDEVLNGTHRRVEDLLAIEDDAAFAAEVNRLVSQYNPTDPLAIEGALHGNATGQDGFVDADTVLDEMLRYDSEVNGTPRRSVEEFEAIESDEEYYAELKRLYEQYAKAEGGYKGVDTETRYDLWAESLTKEQEKRAKVNALEQAAYADPEFAQKSEYRGTEEDVSGLLGQSSIAAKTLGMKEDGTFGLTDWSINLPTMDLATRGKLAYHYINGVYENADDMDIWTKGFFDTYGLNQFTSDEKAVFNYYMHTDPAKAEEYMMSIQSDLWRRRADQQADMYGMLATDYATMAPWWVYEGGAKVVDAFMAVPKMAFAAMQADDPNAPIHDVFRAYTAASGARQEAISQLDIGLWGEALKTADSILSAARDVGFSMATANGLGAAVGIPGAAAAKGSGWLMAAGATSATMSETADDDMSAPARIAYAIGAGAMEMATEKFSIEALLKNPATLRGYLMQNMLTEGTEEVASSLGTTGLDYIISSLDGSKTELQEQYDALVAAGHEDAAKELITSYVGGLAYDFIVGGGTGLVMAGPRATGEYFERRKAGSAVLANQGVQELADIASSMPEGTDSNLWGNILKRNLMESGEYVEKGGQGEGETIRAGILAGESAQEAAEAGAEAKTGETTEAEAAARKDEKTGAQAGQQKEKKPVKKLSLQKIGMLQRALLKDLDAEYHQVVTNTTRDAVQAALEEEKGRLGDEQQGGGYTSKEIAQGIVDMAAGKRISTGLKSYINTSRSGRAVYAAFTAESASALQDGIREKQAMLQMGYGATAKRVAELGKKPKGNETDPGETGEEKAEEKAEEKKETGTRNQGADLSEEGKRAVEEMVSEGAAEGGNAREITYRASDGKKRHAALLRMQNAEDGLVLTVSEDGQEKQVKADDVIGAGSEGVAVAIQTGIEKGGMTGEMSEVLLEALEGSQGSAGETVKEIVDAYQRGALGLEYKARPRLNKGAEMVQLQGEAVQSETAKEEPEEQPQRPGRHLDLNRVHLTQGQVDAVEAYAEAEEAGGKAQEEAAKAVNEQAREAALNAISNVAVGLSDWVNGLVQQMGQEMRNPMKLYEKSKAVTDAAKELAAAYAEKGKASAEAFRSAMTALYVQAEQDGFDASDVEAEVHDVIVPALDVSEAGDVIKALSSKVYNTSGDALGTLTEWMSKVNDMVKAEVVTQETVKQRQAQERTRQQVADVAAKAVKSAVDAARKAQTAGQDAGEVEEKAAAWVEELNQQREAKERTRQQAAGAATKAMDWALDAARKIWPAGNGTDALAEQARKLGDGMQKMLEKSGEAAKTAAKSAAETLQDLISTAMEAGKNREEVKTTLQEIFEAAESGIDVEAMLREVYKGGKAAYARGLEGYAGWVKKTNAWLDAAGEKAEAKREAQEREENTRRKITEATWEAVDWTVGMYKQVQAGLMDPSEVGEKAEAWLEERNQQREAEERDKRTRQQIADAAREAVAKTEELYRQARKGLMDPSEVEGKAAEWVEEQARRREAQERTKQRIAEVTAKAVDWALDAARKAQTAGRADVDLAAQAKKLGADLQGVLEESGKGVQDAAKSAAATLRGLISTAMEAGQNRAEVKTLLQEIFEAAESGIDVDAMLKAANDGYVAVEAAYAKGFEAYSEWAEQAREKAEEVKEKEAARQERARRQVAQAATKAVDWAVDAARKLQKAGRDTSALEARAKELGQEAQQMVDKAGKGMQGFLGALKGMVNTAMETGATAEETTTMLQDVVNAAKANNDVGAIVQGAKEGAEDAQEALGAAVDQLGDWLEQAGAWVRENAQEETKTGKELPRLNTDAEMVQLDGEAVPEKERTKENLPRLNTDVEMVQLDGEAVPVNSYGQKAYELGQKAAEAAEEERRRKAAAKKAVTGMVTFMGDVGNTSDVADTGKREDLSRIRRSLTNQQDAAVRVLEDIAKASGIEVVLYRSSGKKGQTIQTPEGFYEGTTNRVYVDLNAGANVGGEKIVTSTMMRVAGHELTHYIENNSAEEYARLRAYVRQLMQERGQDYAGAVRSRMGGARGLGLFAAEAEVLAEACEQMLQNSRAMETLAKKDPSLLKRIVEFLKAFARRMKRAFAGVTASSREALALTEVRDGAERYIGELQEMWDRALVAASEKESAEGAAEEGGELQYSLRETSKMSWENQVKKVIDNTISHSAVLTVVNSSNVMKLLEENDLPVGMFIDKFRKMMREEKGSRSAHELSEDIMLELPGKIQQPVAFFEDVGRNSVYIVTDLKDKNGRPVVAVIVKNQTDKGNQEMHNMITAYGSDDVLGYLLKEKNFTQGGRYHIYNKKAFADLTGTQLSAEAFQMLSERFIEIVPQSDESVKQFSDRRRAPTMREALAGLQETEDMNQTEKFLLGKYKGYVQELGELEEQMTPVEALLKGEEASTEERVKARNQLEVLRKRARQVEKYLHIAEENESFARMMDVSRELAREMASAESAEELEKQVGAKIKKTDALVKRAREELAALSEGTKAYAEKLEELRRALSVAQQTEAIREQLKTENDNLIKKWYQEKEIMDKNASLRGQIRRVVGWMDSRIRKETDNKRIPEGFKPVVEELIRTLASTNDVLRVFRDKDVQGIIAFYEKLAKLDGSGRSEMDPRYNDYKEELDSAFEEIRGLMDMYQDASKKWRQVDRAELQNEALEAILDVINFVWHTAMDIDAAFVNGKEVQLSDVAARAATELKAKKDYEWAKNIAGESWKKTKELLRTNNLTPKYFFRLMDIPMLTELSEDLFEAQNQYGLLQGEAAEKFAELAKRYNYHAWKDDKALTFTTLQGQRLEDGRHKITLTKDEALALWATWKREHGSTPILSSSHLELGGFRLASGVMDDPDAKRSRQDAEPHKLTEADMRTIEQYLTEEQRAYADAMVEYMSTVGSEMGNEISMQRYGIKKYKESYYFPMKVAREQLERSSSSGAQNRGDTNRIMHTGMTKRRIDQANKPLEIGGFTQVAADHMDQMLLYNTFALPIENLNAVLNNPYNAAETMRDGRMQETARPEESESRMTIRALIEQKAGKDMLNYLERLIADLNGGLQRDPAEQNLFSRGLSLYKRSAVLASLSVALQQPTSIIRAMMVVDPKYFTPIANHRDGVRLREEYEQLKRYSGVAQIKERGGIDMTKSRSGAAALMGNMEDSYGFWQKLRTMAVPFLKGEGSLKERFKASGRLWENLFGIAAQKADEITWAYMWRAVKAETADQNPGMSTGSEAFLQMAAKRFNEVMTLTQVYDSTLAKSQNMRSNTWYAKAFTAFAAEPTLTANMLMDAAASKNAKTISKASAIFLTSAVVTAAFAALAKAGRDDDKEKPWVEKFLASWGNQLGGWSGGLNPLALLPGVRDLMSLMDGYDIERADMSLISDVLEEMRKIESGKYAENPLQGVESVSFALANMLGIPAENVKREALAMYRTVTGIAKPPREVNAMALANDAMRNYDLSLIPLFDYEDAAYYVRLYKAYEAGDAQEQERLKEYLGIRGKDEDAIRSGVKGVVKTKFLDGQMSEKDAKAFLVKHGIVENQQEAFKAVDKWRETPEKGTPEAEDYSYKVYDTVYQAIDGGSSTQIKKAMQELVDNGWALTDVQESVRSYINGKYYAEELSRENVKKLYLEYGGYETDPPENFDPDDENDWYWLYKKLDYGKANGGKTDGYSKMGDFYTAIESGKNLSAVINEYLNHGVEKGTMSNAVTSKYRKQYVNLCKTNRSEAAKLQEKLLRAYQLLGYNWDKKFRDLQKWLEE